MTNIKKTTLLIFSTAMAVFGLLTPSTVGAVSSEYEFKNTFGQGLIGGYSSSVKVVKNGDIFSTYILYFTSATIEQFNADGSHIRSIGERNGDGLTTDGSYNTGASLSFDTSEDSKLLYVGGESDACRIQIFSTETGQYVRTLQGPCDTDSGTYDRVDNVTTLVSGNLLATYTAGDGTRELVLLSSVDGSVIHRYDVADLGSIIGAGPSANSVYMKDGATIRSITLGSALSITATADLGALFPPDSYFVTAASNRLLVVDTSSMQARWLSFDGTVGEVWDFGSLFPPLPIEISPSMISLSFDGSTLVALAPVDADYNEAYFLFKTKAPDLAPTAAVNGNKPLDQTPTIPSRPTFSGTTLPGATVKVVVHSDPVSCSTVADSNGNWSCTLPSDLPAGSHTAHITVTDPDGKVTELGPYPVIVAGQTVTVNLLAPDSGVGSQKINAGMVAAIGVIDVILLLFGYLTSKRQPKR